MDARGIPGAAGLNALHLWRVARLVHLPGARMRVTILYGGAIFACRHCYRLAYPSQRESDHDRAARRADKIRARLGWQLGILNGAGGKPKGMHHRTFQRLEYEHDGYVDLALAGMARLLGIADLK